MTSANIVAKLPLIMQWVYANKGEFIIKDLLREFGIAYNRDNVDFCCDFLKINSLAFRLSFSTFSWMGKDAVFNKKVFAIKPTPFELEKGLLILGSRFEPYVSNIFSHLELTMRYNNQELNLQLTEMPFSEIKKYYYLWSEEEILNNLPSFSLYNKKQLETQQINQNDSFYIPAYHIKKIYTRLNLGENDQMIFMVADWTYRVIDIHSTTRHAVPLGYKKDWVQTFEKFLPLAKAALPTEYNSVTNILANTLFFGRDVLLYHDYCLPLQDYVFEQDMLEEINIGVKSIKWLKDEDRIPQRTWSIHLLELRNVFQKQNNDERFFLSLCSPITEAIIQLFIYSFLEKNYIVANENPEKYQKECVDAFIAAFFPLEKYKPCYKRISNIIERKYNKYKKKYSPFEKKEEMSLAFEMFNIFRRIYLSISTLEQLRIMPRDIGYDLSTIVIQMTKEMSNSFYNIQNILDGKYMQETQKVIVVMRELLEKFSFITERFEEYIFSNFGR